MKKQTKKKETKETLTTEKFKAEGFIERSQLFLVTRMTDTTVELQDLYERSYLILEEV